MGIYDRCVKDVKNCRPHSLKPEDGLLTIDKDIIFYFFIFFIFFVVACIHLRPMGTKP